MKRSGVLNWCQALKYSTLPVLGAMYPAIFHYANNARIVLFSSLTELCVFLACIGLVTYALLAWLSYRKFPQSAAAALLVLVFFYIYGFAFDWLQSIDLFQVDTYNFLPFWIFVAFYLAWIITKLNTSTSIWICHSLLLIFSILMTFNLVKIIPAEIEKRKDSLLREASASADNTLSPKQQSPDIYYLIFDEAAGFEVAREYWHYNAVDQFVDFLEKNEFYVAEQSHGGSIHTLREISTRLNYHEYPVGNEYFETYNSAIGDNSVMSYLKEHGYIMIGYDQRRTYYPTMLPVPVDILVEESPERGTGQPILLDEYKILVLQNTPFRSFLDQDVSVLRLRDMIIYTSENIASMQISSPKFVYAHLMLPHGPFAFSENGTITASNQADYTNWQRYFSNYQFFLHIAQEMVTNILSATKGNAVIIIQSDHGARNFTHNPYTGALQNYSENYKTWIVNALYLPNCDEAPLTQDMDPINTFPIVFNCYFDANIPLK